MLYIINNLKNLCVFKQNKNIYKFGDLTIRKELCLIEKILIQKLFLRENIPFLNINYAKIFILYLN